MELNTTDVCEHATCVCVCVSRVASGGRGRQVASRSLASDLGGISRREHAESHIGSSPLRLFRAGLLLCGSPLLVVETLSVLHLHLAQYYIYI